MTETRDKIIRGALDAFSRYSVERTTMADIAKEAGVSRQTLYSTLGSKEEVIAHVFAFADMAELQRVKIRIVECKSLSEQLDVYFEERVISPFDRIHSEPGAERVWADSHVLDHPKVAESKQADYQFLAELFLPYTAKLGDAGQSPAELAAFVIFVCSSLRYDVHSDEKLKALLATFKTTVLTMALGRT